MKLTQTKIKDVCAIGIEGPFCSTDSTFVSAIEEAINQGNKSIIIDLRNTLYFNSSGLASLVIALKKIRSIGGKMFLLGPTNDMKSVFRLTQLDRVFKIVNSAQDLSVDNE